MLKIKDCLLNGDEILYIQPLTTNYGNVGISVKFINSKIIFIKFEDKKERDKELDRVLKKVGKDT